MFFLPKFTLLIADVNLRNIGTEISPDKEEDPIDGTREGNPDDKDEL